MEMVNSLTQHQTKQLQHNSDGDESGSYNSEESDYSDNSYSDDNTYSEEEE